MSETVEAEIVPNKTQGLVVRHEETGAVGILRPADSLDRIAEAFEQYKAVCEKILDKSDVQEYEGKPRKKKSAWRKLATAFNVSTSLVKQDITEDSRGRVLKAKYVFRAFTGPEANPWRQMVGTGSCSVYERCCPTAEGKKCRKAAWKGHYCCVNGCDGRIHWSHPDHDVPTTAETRAKNRAIADLIGCGEVSAEELSGENEPPPPPPPGNAPGRKEGCKDTPPPPATAPTPIATPKHLARLVEALASKRELVERYFRAIDWLLPTESLEKLELRYVPASKEQFDALTERLNACENGEPATPPYPVEIPIQEKPPKQATPKHEQADWWRGVIVPIPHKDQKRDEYMKHPETIGQLYDLRHGQDEQAQAARQRLWGFIEHYEPKGWEKRDGTKMPPSESDLNFRKALDACKQWHEQNHPEEKL